MQLEAPRLLLQVCGSAAAATRPAI
eukprot:COSAG06_NODE_66850_length_253_cov_0.675325_1_plen_24_part_10